MVKLHTFSVGGMGSIPGWETDPTYCEHSRKKKKKKKNKKGGFEKPQQRGSWLQRGYPGKSSQSPKETLKTDD